MSNPSVVGPKVWTSARRVFDAAIQLPREDREAYVREACGGDIAVRELVERILAGDDRFADDAGGAGPGEFGLALPGNADPPGGGAGSPSGAVLSDPGPAAALDAGAQFQPDTLLSGRYRILRQLGRGGMGVVYAAQDIRLQRQVALKFLRPAWSRDEVAMKRFLREARAASALDHPNICTVHEIAEMENHELFIVMAFYDGETLDRKIRRGSLSVDEAINVTVQVARALDRAHEAGIVHRDIKPANIMITRHGEVKVLDFGLAELFGQSQSGRIGQVMGTVAYMSPEQLRGEPVDRRTDLWSLGVSLYEMLTGRLPFVGEPREAASRSILKDKPGPAGEVPRALLPVLQQTLQKRPRQRYQRARHLIDDLEPLRAPTSAGHRSTTGRQPATGSAARWGWPAGGLAAALVAVLVLLQVLPPFRGSRVESVVVLPFENLASDPADDYFVDGLTESLIAELGTIGALRVISRTTAMSYRDSALSLSEIARQLDVDAIVEGAVLKDDDQVRLTARLIHGHSEELLWTATYDRDFGDSVSLMGDVARQIAGGVRVALTPDEAGRLRADRRVNPRALELYLRGRYLWHAGTLESSRAARELFREAIEVAPGYALAHAGLADAYPGSYYASETTAEKAFSNARRHARRAIELDDTLAEAYTSLTRVALEWDWDWEASGRYVRRALELNPNYAVAHHWLAWHFATVGRFEEAVEQIERAQLLDPLSSRISADRVRFVYLAGRYDEAIESARALLGRDPHRRVPRRFLGRALLEQGLFAEALVEIEKVADSSSSMVALGELGHAYAVAGREQEASRMLDLFLAEDPQPAFSIALVHLGLGQREEALAWLDRAYDERSIRMIGIKGDPRLDPLRSDPGFNDLLQRMNLDDRSLQEVGRGPG